MAERRRPSAWRVVRAGIAAAALSGLPSTAFALATGRDPLAATRAAARMAPGWRARPQVVVGIGVHLVVSATWTVAFALGARARPMTTTAGAIGGAAIAALDLGVIAPRSYPAVAALPRWPQVADHLAFGAILGRMLRDSPPSASGAVASRSGPSVSRLGGPAPGA